MTTGKNFARVAEQLRGGGSVYVVDVAGNVHSLDVEAYTALTAEQLKGAKVFFDPAKAERCGEIRRATRN